MGAVPITLERGKALQRQARLWSINARIAAIHAELDELRREVVALVREAEAELDRVKPAKRARRAVSMAAVDPLDHRKTRKRRP